MSAETVQFSVSCGAAESTLRGTVLFNETLETAVGSMKVVALTAPDNPNESVSVSAPGASTSINLPASVLGKAQDGETGIALLSVTSMAASSTNAFENLTSPSEDEPGQKQKTELQSEIININLRDNDGESLNLDKLEEPIELMFDIAVNTSDSMGCAFWDEEELRWSSEGVITANSSHPDQVRCLTFHLSIFAVVRYVPLLTDIGMKLATCSSVAQMLAPEGWAKIYSAGNGRRMLRSPGFWSVLLGSLVFSFALFFASCWTDYWSADLATAHAKRKKAKKAATGFWQSCWQSCCRLKDKLNCSTCCAGKATSQDDSKPDQKRSTRSCRGCCSWCSGKPYAIASAMADLSGIRGLPEFLRKVLLKVIHGRFLMDFGLYILFTSWDSVDAFAKDELPMSLKAARNLAIAKECKEDGRQRD